MKKKQTKHPSLFHKKVAFNILCLLKLYESLIHFGLLAESEHLGNNFGEAKKPVNKSFQVTQKKML